MRISGIITEIVILSVDFTKGPGGRFLCQVSDRFRREGRWEAYAVKEEVAALQNGRKCAMSDPWSAGSRQELPSPGDGNQWRGFTAIQLRLKGSCLRGQ